jgi:hypothetical protein
MKDKYVYPHVSDTGPRPGMELRDWFAGQVVIGLLSNPKHNDDDSEYIALLAYGVANCLMEEREEN